MLSFLQFFNLAQVVVIHRYISPKNGHIQNMKVKKIVSKSKEFCHFLTFFYNNKLSYWKKNSINIFFSQHTILSSNHFAQYGENFATNKSIV